MMQNPRTYGPSPYSAAVIHGGPGALGEMAPVAKELSRSFGVLEPLQTVADLDGQIVELAGILDRYANLPVVLIGHSWGAWLSFILAARYPELVRKVILIGCGPFEATYVPLIHETRAMRMNRQENKLLRALLADLNGFDHPNKENVLKALGHLMEKSDSYDLLPEDGSDIEIRPEAFCSALNEALQMRTSGELLELACRIRCPLVVIHGDYDPHPLQGVVGPLSRIIRELRLFRLDKCGHSPWKERYARERFFEILEEEMRR